VNDENGPVKNVSVLFNNERLKTDSLGEATFHDQHEGTFEFAITSPYHYDTTGYVTLEREAVIFYIVLTELPVFDARFEIANYAGKIDSAQFILNDSLIYRVINGNLVIPDLYPGHYSYRVIREGYYSSTSGFQIIDTNYFKEVYLEIIKYNVLFNVKSGQQLIENAAISLLDTTLYTSGFGQALLNNIIPDSGIAFQIKKEGFNIYRGSFNLTTKSLNLYINLTPVGVQQNAPNKITVYPNPLAGQNQLTLIGESVISQVQFYSIHGKMLFKSEPMQYKYLLNTKNWHAGVYLLKVRCNNQLEVFKIIIE
jgi:hypothetical protein